VDDPHITPEQLVTEQLSAPIEHAAVAAAQVVDVGVNAVEVGRTHDHVVCIDDPDVVAVPLGEGQRLRPVVAEVPPRPFVKLTGYAKVRHVAADHVLGAIVGAGIHDHPGGDMGRDRAEHLLDDVRLVADDHVEADRGARGHRVAAIVSGSSAAAVDVSRHRR
jgi:hypothetical protein